MKPPSQPISEFALALEGLKRALKQRHITYKELADGIGMSESGVKKFFSAQDGSFGRISQICQYVGVSLHEILEDKRSLAVSFTEKQQQAFLQKPGLFQVYWLLVYERQSLDFIKSYFSLKQAELFPILRELDLLNLIKLLPKDRIQLPSIKTVHWIGDNEFIRKIYREWSLSLLRSVNTPQRDKDDFFLLRYLQMSPETYKEFIEAQKSLEEEFVRRSINEMKKKSKDLHHVRWLSGIDRKSFVTNK